MKRILAALLIVAVVEPLVIAGSLYPLKTAVYLQKMSLVKGQLIIEKVEYIPADGSYTGMRWTEYYGCAQGPVKLVKTIETNDKKPSKQTL